jgi:hypothetical protein
MIDACCPKCGRIHHVGDEHAGFLMVCSGCGGVLPIVQMPGYAAHPIQPIGPGASGPTQRVPPKKVEGWQNLGQSLGRSMRFRLSKPAWAILVFAVAMTLIVISETRSSNQQPRDDKPAGDQNPTTLPAEAPEAPEPTLPQTNAPAQTNQDNPGTDQPTASTAPPPNPSIPKPIQPRPHRDLGVDLALPLFSRVSLMDFTDPNGKVVRNIAANDVLVLVDRAPTNGWLDVIDVRSGKEGWVDQDDVQIQLTQHPEQAAKLTEEYVGSDDPPEVSVENATDKVLSLKIGQKSYSLEAGSTISVSLPAGTYSYYAWEPGVIPDKGRDDWKSGYKYTWKFYVRTVAGLSQP